MQYQPLPPPIRVTLYLHPRKQGWLIAHGEGAEFSYEFENTGAGWINQRLYLESLVDLKQVPTDEEYSIRMKTGEPDTFRDRFHSY